MSYILYIILYDCVSLLNLNLKTQFIQKLFIRFATNYKQLCQYMYLMNFV